MGRERLFECRFSQRSWVRRRLAALMAMAAAGATVGSAPASAVGEVVANGTARVTAVAPISGGLSLEVGLGSAIADLKGATPRAESATLKPGIVGLLAGSTVPLPGPSKADLRGERSVDRASVAPPLDLGAVRLAATRERASVTGEDVGFGASARTDLTDLVVAGAVELSGGTAEASATTKEATGRSALGRITIAIAGTTLVDLHDVEWRVRSKLGEDPHATFSIGSAEIQGDRRAIDSPAELAAALEPLNPLLRVGGIGIKVPQVDKVAGGAALSPLVIESVNAEVLRGTVGAAYPQIAPLYNEVATQLQGQAAEAGLALLVANVGLSIATGNGGVRVALGGATAAIAPRETFGAARPDAGSQLRSSTAASPPTDVGSGGSSESGFFPDAPAARRELAAASSRGDGGQVSGTSAALAPTATGGVAAQPLSVPMTPLGSDGSPVPATIVLTAVLAGVTALAARDQMTVRRRDALRQARARSVSI